MRFELPFFELRRSLRNPAAGRCVLAATVVGVSILLAGPARASEPVANPSASPAAEAKDGSDETQMLRDIPMDETFQGLRIPHMSPEGKLIMLLDTKSARRVDDGNIAMQGLRIEFSDDDEKTFVVTMDEAIFNLESRVLKTDTSVTIQREDFVIDGDAAEFDTKNRVGRIDGNVKMVIFNTENLNNE